MAEGVIQRGFAGGELAPIFHARADHVRYTQGLRTCLNFLVRKEGGVANRPGTRFAVAAKTNTAGTKFARFVPSSGDGYLIEMGAGYFRFLRNGAYVQVSGVPAYSGATAYVPGDLVSSGGVNYYCHAATTGNAPPNATYWHALTGAIYEVPTPYALASLPGWSQSGNIVTLTHGSHALRELEFVSSTRWVLSLVTTAPGISAPTGLSETGGPLNPGPKVRRYVVTAVRADDYEESVASASLEIVAIEDPSLQLPQQLNWTAVAGAVEYFVYCDPYQNGVYGYIGSAGTNTFFDIGFVPDFNVTPPIGRSLFVNANEYPSVSASYQQRRFVAGTNLIPDGVWGSRVGFRSNFSITSPLQDDDAVTFRLAGNQAHPIRHMIALRAGLVLLTDAGEWTVTGGGGAKTPITPSSIDAEQETYVGVSSVRPLVVGNGIVYIQARGSVPRELRFEQQVEGLAGRDLGLYASHLFKRHTIVDADYQQIPDSIGWFVRNDGVLLGLTYVPEQDVWGWHRHTTDGLFEAVCVVPEADEDVVYVLVSRTVGGVTARYIERLARRENAADGFFDSQSIFLDSSLSYSGTPVTSVSGVSHLEGRQVYALVDGVTRGPFTVSSGAVALGVAGSNVHVGLRYTSELETLDLDVQGSAIRDKRKRVATVRVLVERSGRTFQAGPDTANLRTFSPETWEGDDDAWTGAAELHVPSEFNDYGRLVIRQTDPLPLTILGVMPTIEMGG